MSLIICFMNFKMNSLPWFILRYYKYNQSFKRVKKTRVERNHYVQKSMKNTLMKFVKMNFRFSILSIISTFNFIQSIDWSMILALLLLEFNFEKMTRRTNWWNFSFVYFYSSSLWDWVSWRNFSTISFSLSFIETFAIH